MSLKMSRNNIDPKITVINENLSDVQNTFQSLTDENEKQAQEIKRLMDLLAKQRGETSSVSEPVLIKREILPTEPAFGGAVPFPVAVITALDKDGYPDICPIKYWGFINGIPKLMYISLCQRDQNHAPPLKDWPLVKSSLKPHDPTREEKKDPFKRRYTAKCVDETNELVINIPPTGQESKYLDTALHSGFFEPGFDKWLSAGYTKGVSKFVKTPYINECPINIECRVLPDRLHLPTHDLFILEPLLIHTIDGVKQQDGQTSFVFQLEAPLVQKRVVQEEKNE